MKQLYALLMLIPTGLMAQSLVSTSPQNRTALLEDFTGVNCGYCPEGHVIAHDLADAHPGEVVVVGVHAGSFAVPSGSQPDFRTPEGTTINDHFGVNSYPAGIVDRYPFSGGIVQGRGAWEGMVNEALELPSPVNIGLESSYNSGAQQLDITVELFYTSDSPGGNDYIHVLVKEDHLTGWQTDYGNGNQPNYDHTEVMRAYATPVWGDEVTTTTAGSSVTRTYSLAVNAAWTLANLEVVAFVGEYQGQVYQAREVMADGGTTLVVGELTSTAGSAFQSGSPGSGLSLGNDLTNLLGADEDYEVSLSSADAPGDWTGTFSVGGMSYNAPATINITDGSTEAITVDITPGNTVGIATYTLTVASTSNNNAPVLVQEYHVISGVTDLVVNNPQAETHEPIYEGALSAANQLGRAKTSRNTFLGFGEAGALTDVLNLYLNVSWTFPSITDDVVGVLEDFLDNGGNLFIAGQDIGWDQSGDANAYGTAITQAFYSDYMHATYIADGSTANSSVTFEAGDLVFGNVPGSGIKSVFDTNSYPEEIEPIAPAVPILRYNNPNKIGGLRVETGGYKLVYFGVGPEQMSDPAVAEAMVRLSHDWFYGIVSVDELDAAFAALLGQAWPVPADDRLTIPVGEVPAGTLLRVTDATGRLVHQERVGGMDRIVLNTSTLGAGLHHYRLLAPDGRSAARAFVVQH